MTTGYLHLYCAAVRLSMCYFQRTPGGGTGYCPAVCLSVSQCQCHYPCVNNLKGFENQIAIDRLPIADNLWSLKYQEKGPDPFTDICE